MNFVSKQLSVLTCDREHVPPHRETEATATQREKAPRPSIDLQMLLKKLERSYMLINSHPKRQRIQGKGVMGLFAESAATECDMHDFSNPDK